MDWLKGLAEGFFQAIERGDAVWWVLAVLAFASLVALLYEAFSGAVRMVAPPSLRVHLFEHLKQGRRIQALQQAQQDNSPFANIARTALRLPENSPSYMTYASAEEALNREAAVLRARVSVLGGLAVAALLIGTIGVLGGMLSVLRSATAAVSAATLAAEAAASLKAALAAGILAALIAGFYYTFLTRSHTVEALLWSETERLVAMLLGAAPDGEPGTGWPTSSELASAGGADSSGKEEEEESRKEEAPEEKESEESGSESEGDKA